MAGGSVGLTEVIGYGFRLMGMMILIGLVAAVFIVPGSILSGASLFTDGEAEGGAMMVIGFVLMFIGSLVYIAGFMGLMFKVMSDAVARGIPRPRQPAGPTHDPRGAPQPGPHAVPGNRPATQANPGQRA